MPVTRDGILMFGAAARGEPPSDATYLDAEIRAAEARHFWFRGRLQLVLWMLRRYFPGAQRLLDVGCGTGFVLEGIRRHYPRLGLTGCDVRLTTLLEAHRQMPETRLFAADVFALPYETEFDVVVALDVLEHIDDDRVALSALRNVIKPGGGLILTVPQHPRLWSEVDEFSCHRRRYVRFDLESKVSDAGFDILRRTSLFAVTLPLVVASRFFRHRSPFDPAAELKVPAVLNSGLAALVALERLLIRIGGTLPFGSSLVVVGRRPIAV
jgi:SAM-dependent methyltransferase